jgi:YVTN family beta-propeller protein
MDLDTRARRATDEMLRIPRDLDAGLADLHRTRRHRAFGKAVAVSVVLVLALAGVLVGRNLAHRPEPSSPIHKWVIPVPGGNASGERFGFGSVWVTVVRRGPHNPPGYVDRFDPVTRRVITSIQVGANPQDAAQGFGSMWVANISDGTVTRIDPSTNTVLATIKVGPVPNEMAAAGGGLWITTENSAVKIDPTTNTVVATAPYPHPGHSELGLRSGLGLDANAQGVWVTTPYGTVLRFRPSDGKLLATIPVLRASDTDPGPVHINGDNVWVADNTWKTISGGQVTPKNKRVWHLTDISATTDKIINRVTTGHYGPYDFIPQNGTLFIVCANFRNHTSELIRTDPPYRTETYARPLAANASTFVDTHGALWIPTWAHRAVQIVNDANGRPDKTTPGG